ncbi:DUF3303 domain-containing protein [Acidobacteriota bacterium]
MAKYFVLWEMDPTRVPEDPKERAAGWTLLMSMVKQDMQKGFTKDWGAIPGELNGYFIIEATEVELMMVAEQYNPYVSFQVHPVATVAQIDQLLEAMSQ